MINSAAQPIVSRDRRMPWMDGYIVTQDTVNTSVWAINTSLLNGSHCIPIKLSQCPLIYSNYMLYQCSTLHKI